MLACTFVHRKFLGRTPPGKAVLRAFLGGMRNEALMAGTDEVLIATVRRELSEILGDPRLSGRHIEPEYAQVTRWRRAMAQYAVGHQDAHDADQRARLRRCPGCSWPAMPTTASAFPTASGWDGMRRADAAHYQRPRLRFTNRVTSLTRNNGQNQRARDAQRRAGPCWWPSRSWRRQPRACPCSGCDRSAESCCLKPRGECDGP